MPGADAMETTVKEQVKRKYDINHIWPTNLTDPSKLIYEIGRSWDSEIWQEEASKEKEGRKARRQKFKGRYQLKCLFWYLFLTGSRISECRINDKIISEEKKAMPLPRALQVSQDRIAFVQIIKSNSKHPLKWKNIERDGKMVKVHDGENEVIQCHFPLDDPYDAEMWKLVLNGGKDLNLSFLDMFNAYVFHKEEMGRVKARIEKLKTMPKNEEKLKELQDRLAKMESMSDELIKDRNRTRLNKLVKWNFRTDLWDGRGTPLLNHGFSLHSLRHLRAFDLLIKKGYRPEIVQSLLGWSSPGMLSHYVYIRDQLKGQVQRDMITNFLVKNNSKMYPIKTDYDNVKG
jgi:integrase